MKTSKLKQLSGALLTMGLLSMPALVMAKNLTINNHTKAPLTVKINHVCSGEDGFGVMPVEGTKTVSEGYLANLCGVFSVNCIATLFSSTNCSGNQIAYFIFDSKKGLKDIGIPLGTKYAIHGDYVNNAVSMSESVR